jgi:hypothetical protein
MNGSNFTKARKKSVLEGPQSVLERRLIKEYLLKKGYRLADLEGLPKNEAKLLKLEACLYASLKLAEVESRARFTEKIHFPW